MTFVIFSMTYCTINHIKNQGILFLAVFAPNVVVLFKSSKIGIKDVYDLKADLMSALQII